MREADTTRPHFSLESTTNMSAAQRRRRRRVRVTVAAVTRASIAAATFPWDEDETLPMLQPPSSDDEGAASFEPPCVPLLAPPLAFWKLFSSTPWMPGPPGTSPRIRSCGAPGPGAPA